MPGGVAGPGRSLCRPGGQAYGRRIAGPCAWAGGPGRTAGPAGILCLSEFHHPDRGRACLGAHAADRGPGRGTGPADRVLSGRVEPVAGRGGRAAAGRSGTRSVQALSDGAQEQGAPPAWPAGRAAPAGACARGPECLEYPLRQADEPVALRPGPAHRGRGAGRALSPGAPAAATGGTGTDPGAAGQPAHPDPYLQYARAGKGHHGPAPALPPLGQRHQPAQ